ncbi:plasmid segregation protein ParM domain-containing protein [Nostoc sp. FACHB-190]|uniref:plasmid segregation protein ParM domain-containing protein n=1 Tax=Nostoc sp. FACHB-190 TaxID=2692838 RepID=UPI0016863B59|nr:plasmid segregation protein ParM domain-containing protein [Nostoc sp. FACHB-190]MBD2303596.1 hypothetical protein [Nostoc sp. FACHB-190]
MINIYFADIGNFTSITALKGEKPRVMRSVFQDVTYTSARDYDTEDSPSVKLDNKVLVLGERATKQKNPQTAAERGKQLPEFVKPFTLAGLRQDFEGTVRFLVPERNHWEEDTIRQTLVADHQVTVNGRSYKHRIKNVEFYLETDVAVANGYKKGFLNSGDTLGIDIGGGTTNYVVMTSNGEVLTRRSIPKVGGVSLANDIINSDLMQSYAKRDNVAFKVAKMMDAIADGSFTYGRKYDFSSVFPGLLENWFNGLMDGITTAANDYLADVTNIMLIGGCANLVRHKLSAKPGFYIPVDPHLSNIQALLAM